MITRFAPSPTGYLHLGHAYAALQAFNFASDHGGTCLLRIEDIDNTRCRSHYTDAIYEDLAWLGFSWPKPALVQSVNLNRYRSTLENLKSRGLIYPCFKTRKEIYQSEQELGSPYRRDVYPERTLEIQNRIDAGETPAWRLSLVASKAVLGSQFDWLSYVETGGDRAVTHRVDLSTVGDVTLARKDIGTSYHLACCHDDAAQGVTHVVRGTDLVDLTGTQVLLQALMKWPTPTYHHHGLILKGDGEKLSKRKGDKAIRSLGTDGLSPSQVLDMAKRAAAS